LFTVVVVVVVVVVMSNAKAGKGMAGLNVGVSGEPRLKAKVSGCAGALCGMVETLEGSRKNQQITVRMGAPDDLLTVSSAWSVRIGDVVAVAPVGSVVGDNGVVTKPFLLDEAQLGWEGASSNSAAILNHYDLLPGDSAPAQRPERRRHVKEVDNMGNEIVEEGMESLYVTKPKLTKEEKAAAKADKAKLKAIANGTWVEPEEEDIELKKASKKEIKEAKSRAKQRRGDGEDEVTTDVELESAGLFQ
jgi:hypothetical protein